MTGRSRVKTSGETSLNGDIGPLVQATASELKKVHLRSAKVSAMLM